MALSAALSPQPLVLEGRFCRLEPLVTAHAQALYAATTGEGEAERYRWLFESPPSTAQALSGWIETTAARTDMVTFAVIAKATGLCGGRQALMRIVPEHGVIEIGSILWGRTIARTPIATRSSFPSSPLRF
jgi:RimJ/RimL family protein N-acetyltransferase